MKKLSAVLFATILAAMLVGAGMGQQGRTQTTRTMSFRIKSGKTFAFRSAGPVCLQETLTNDGDSVLLEIDETRNPEPDFVCGTKESK
jgi:hypothetical protein